MVRGECIQWPFYCCFGAQLYNSVTFRIFCNSHLFVEVNQVLQLLLLNADCFENRVCRVIAINYIFPSSLNNLIKVISILNVKKQNTASKCVAAYQRQKRMTF